MQLRFDIDKLGNTFSELDAFFDYPRPEPCLEKLTEVLENRSKGSVIKLYLENFKSFNETFGYQFGGLFLREIARFLCRIEGADVYRTAGVEFVIILEKVNRSAAAKILEDITARFEESWHINNVDCMCSVNLALALYPGHASSASDMLDQLNYAIAESALKGPNNYAVFDEDLDRKLYRRNAIARLIPTAVETGRLELRYRPTFHIPSQRFIRADSYVRLISPEFGIIQASEFVPIAEESGQIYMVSQYAVTMACRLIARLIAMKVEFETIAVPVSPIQFLQDRFVDDVAQIIKEAGISPRKLAFEVTESVALNAFSSSQARMHQLSEMGIEIIFAEFGTGYSGLNNILSLPVNTVKMERMLTWQMENDPQGSFLMEGLIHTAKNLRMNVIAEGVETQAQVDLLKEYGCDYQQGFYYSSTLTPEELIDAFQRNDLTV